MHQMSNGRHDCFPEAGDKEELPQSIPVSEICAVIEEKYQAILQRIDALFRRNSDSALLQKSRGRLFALSNDLKKAIGTSQEAEAGSDLRTFGDVRRVRKKIERIIAEHKQGHAKFKDRRLDPRVVAIVQQEFQDVAMKYTLHIASRIPSPDQLSVETTLRGISMLTDNGQNKKKRRRAKRNGNGTEDDGTALGDYVRNIFDEDESASVRASVPSWLSDLHEQEACELKKLLIEHASNSLLSRKLHIFFRATASRYATNERERDLVIRRIMHAIVHPNSVLSQWLHKPDEDIQINQKDIADPETEPRTMTIPMPAVVNAFRRSELEPAEPITEDQWQSALVDPSIMLQVFEKIDAVAWQGEQTVKQMLPASVAYSTVRAVMANRAMYEYAVHAIAELNEHGKVTLTGEWKNSMEVMQLIVTHVRKDVLNQIERGISVFGPDEADVALELQLKEYKLWNTYTHLKKKREQEDHLKSDVQDPSESGFNHEEIMRISKEDRTRVNDLFAKLSLGKKKLWSPSEISQADAAILREIMRILLTHSDSCDHQFHQRLGMPAVFVWKSMHRHKLMPLSFTENAALSQLEREVIELGRVKDTDDDAYTDRKMDMLRRVVVYRRLLRFQQSIDGDDKLRLAAEILGLPVRELATLEWKTYHGLTNAELAPDLFPDELLEENMGPGFEEEQEEKVTDKGEIPAIPPIEQSAETPIDSVVIGSDEEEKSVDENATTREEPKSSVATDLTSGFKNIHDAIKHGVYDFEPIASASDFQPTDAMPGTLEKKEVIRFRVEHGLPLMHPLDRKELE